MRDACVLILCIVLSFLYTIIIRICRRIKTLKLNRTGIFIWAILVLIIGVRLSGSFLRTVWTFNPAELFRAEYVIFLVICVFSAWVSGYKYGSKEYNIQMMVIFPIIEEILFRGTMVPLLLSVSFFNPMIAWTADGLLFGVMHFQYFGFTKVALRKVMISVFGGFFFAYFSYRSQSIIPSLIAHVIFNTSAILYTRMNRKNNDFAV